MSYRCCDLFPLLPRSWHFSSVTNVVALSPLLPRSWHFSRLTNGLLRTKSQIPDPASFSSNYSFIKDKSANFQFQFVDEYATMGNGIYKTIFLKSSGGSLIERRAAKRFQVDWQILVESDGAGGERI